MSGLSYPVNPTPVLLKFLDRPRHSIPAARRVGQGVMDVNQVERPIQQRMGICLAEGRDIWVTDSWIWLEEVTGQQDDYDADQLRGVRD